MSYRVQLTSSAQADLRRLAKPDLEVALQQISELEKNPFKGETLKGSLRGARSLKFSLSGGEHRAAYYVVTEDKTCVVFMVKSRERFSEEATRRFKALR